MTKEKTPFRDASPVSEGRSSSSLNHVWGMLSATILSTAIPIIIFLLSISFLIVSCDKIFDNSRDGKDYEFGVSTDTHPAWNPKSGLIAYEHSRAGYDSSADGIYLVNEDGTGKRLLAEGGSFPRWNPSGTSVAYGSLIDGYIYLVNVKDLKTRQMNFANGSSYPAFSSDGKYLAFSELVAASDLPSHERFLHIRIVDLEADSSYFLPNRPSDDLVGWQVFGWQPGTHDILFGRYDPRSIWIVDFLGTNMRKLLDRGDELSWSPGGDSLCYNSLDCYGAGCWSTKILNMKGGKTSKIGEFHSPCFSPDGTKLVYSKEEGDLSDPTKGRYRLWIHDLRTGVETQLTK